MEYFAFLSIWIIGHPNVLQLHGPCQTGKAAEDPCKSVLQDLKAFLSLETNDYLTYSKMKALLL